MSRERSRDFTVQPANQELIALGQLERDRRVLIRTVPPHLILVALEDLNKSGETFRKDVVDALTVAVMAPLSGLDELSISRLVKKTDETASALLRELGCNTAREVILTAAGWVARLVDEGMMPDPGNQSVLVSLHLLDEAQEDPENWGYSPFRLKMLTDNMMTRAKLHGLIS